MKASIAFAAAGLVLLSACAPVSQRQLSAGRMGCPAQEIQISNDDSTRHTRTWSASCRGQTYFCSSTDDFLEVICKPELKSPVRAAAAPALETLPAPGPSAEPAAVLPAVAADAPAP